MSAGNAAGELTLSLDPESVRVAEPLTLTVTGDTPGLTWPDWAEALPGWDVVPQSVDDRQATLTLRSWLPGEIAIPAVTVATAGGVTYATEPRTVTVASVLPDDADVADAAVLRDLAGALPGAAPSRWRPTWWQAAALGVGVLALAAAIWRWRRPRAPVPEAVATQRLDAAEATGDIGEAVHAVRQYVATRFGHRLLHQTPAELADDAEARRALGQKLRDELVALQRLAEKARFANAPEAAPAAFIARARGVFDQARTTARAQRGEGAA